MGNFISNQQQANTDIGIMVQVDIVKNKGVSKARVGNYGYIPVWRYIHKSTTGKTTLFRLARHVVNGMPICCRAVCRFAAAMLRAAEAVRKRLSGSPEIRY